MGLIFVGGGAEGVGQFMPQRLRVSGCGPA